MGFKPSRQYELDFSGTKLDGLEVTVGHLSTGDYLKVQGLQENGQIEPLIDVFSGKLRSWNMENDDDSPKGTTPEDIKSIPVDILMEVIQAWIKAVIGVASPLDGESTTTSNTLLESIPKETLS